MSEDIFSCLAKYGPAADENYLTEALVFVTRLLLERSPSVGLEMVNWLCCQSLEPWFDDPDSVALSTQATTDQGTPDIEIKGPETLVYMEVKHDSPLGANQLERYKAQLDTSEVSNKRLVLLARSQYTAFDTSLKPDDYHRVYWYEVYNSLAKTDVQDDISQFFVRSLMSFLEEKGMSMKKVTWQYIEGILALLSLTDMLERAVAEAMPGTKFNRTPGWGRRGLYLPGDYWFGVRYDNPGVVEFQNNRGEKPTYRCDLDLEQERFFCMTKHEQLQCLVEFLRDASKGAPEVS
jgi:hypothetical protein